MRRTVAHGGTAGAVECLFGPWGTEKGGGALGSARGQKYQLGRPRVCYHSVVGRYQWKVVGVGALPIALVASAIHYLTGLVQSSCQPNPPETPDAKAAYVFTILGDAALNYAYFALAVMIALAALTLTTRQRSVIRALYLASSSVIVANLVFFAFILAVTIGVRGQL